LKERENGKRSKTLSEFKNSNFFGSDIASSSAKEPKEKKGKINKKYSDARTILVRAFNRRGEEFHVAEAEITLDSDGAFAVDYVAAKLLLKGTLYVSDIPLGRQYREILTRLRLFTQGTITCMNRCPRIL
jgi:hypothetical protein